VGCVTLLPLRWRHLRFAYYCRPYDMKHLSPVI
jgi:hypothetical protein